MSTESIIMIEDATGPGGAILAKGTTQTLSTALATALISQGRARPASVETNATSRGRRIPVEMVPNPDGGIGFSIPQASPMLSAATRELVAGLPCDIVLFGDSTGDEKSEWFYLLGQYLSGSLAANHSVAYRLWSDANQQYSGAEYISTGPQGRRYIDAGAASTSHRIVLDSSDALNITGDLDIRLRVNLNGGSPSSQFALAAKYGAAGNRSWRIELTPGNLLWFEHSADGTTLINRNSGTAIPAERRNVDMWIRVLLDIDDLEGYNVCRFFTSIDEQASWQELGGGSKLAGATLVYASTTGLQLIGRGAASISNLGKDFRFYELRMYGSLNGTDLRAWIDCGSVPQRSTLTSAPYRDDMGNPGTITFQGSTIGGSPRLCMFNGSVGGQVVAYATDAARFAKLAAGGMQIAYINYSHNQTATTNFGTTYKTLTDLIQARNPEAAIVGVLQNRRYPPATGIPEHEIRLQSIARYCASARFDTLDFFGLVQQAEMKSDGIHPDPATGVGVRMSQLAHVSLQSAAGRFSRPA